VGFNKQALSIDDPNSLWVIVNKHRPLADPNYVPSPISDAPVPYAFASTLRTEAADALTTMFAAYTSETGGEMMLQSVYRSYDTQAELYRGDDTLTARPGHSEHQTGLAADIGDISGQCAVQTCFAQMQAGQWLAANAWRFGFVLRYPDGFIEITGYEFEPWHYRFVGVELATEMHNTGTPTLEQFFGLDPAPRYLDQG
jgi:D-alanyl-D-alanine carboxypeptidase